MRQTIERFRERNARRAGAETKRKTELTMEREGLRRKQASGQTEQAVSQVSNTYDRVEQEMQQYFDLIKEKKEYVTKDLTQDTDLEPSGVIPSNLADPAAFPLTEPGPGGSQSISSDFEMYEPGETQILFELKGKKRPNKPKAALLQTLDVAASSAFGPGAKVVVYSGQENEGGQHGSNRHKTGLAADIRVYRPDGSLVKLNDKDAGTFAMAAAKAGAVGIGAGSEYMGDAFHIDMFPKEKYSKGQGHVWGSFAKTYQDQLLPILAKN